MPIYAKNKGGGTFAPATAGLHAAVCVDVVDLGMQDDKYNEGKLKHRIRIVWQIDERRKDTKLFEVSKWYTLSLHEKATLRKDLESWRGRAFTDQQLEEYEHVGFDVETLIGAPAYLHLIHKRDDGKYADVAAIMKLPANVAKISAESYVRVKDRKDTESEAIGIPNGNSDHFEIDDNDVPF